jgi:hypothetical protein
MAPCRCCCHRHNRQAGSGLGPHCPACRPRCGRHTPDLRSASGRLADPRHRPGYGSWLSDHRASAPSTRLGADPRPRLALHADPRFDVACVLIQPDRRGVDHLPIADPAAKRRSRTPLPPQRRTCVGAGRTRPVALGECPYPKRAGPEPPVDAVQHPTVIRSRHPAWLVGEQRLND